MSEPRNYIVCHPTPPLTTSTIPRPTCTRPDSESTNVSASTVHILGPTTTLAAPFRQLFTCRERSVVQLRHAARRAPETRSPCGHDQGTRQTGRHRSAADLRPASICCSSAVPLQQHQASQQNPKRSSKREPNQFAVLCGEPSSRWFVARAC